MLIAPISVCLYIFCLLDGIQSCRPNGGYCQTHGDCCSGKCQKFNYVCAAKVAPDLTMELVNIQTPQCHQNGVKCQTDISCCSGYCKADNLECAPKPDFDISCQPIGGYCQVHGNCCSGKCLKFHYECTAKV